MKIAVVGTGYVGLVSGVCFADAGNDVACIDVDAAKIARLEQGETVIYEPGLSEILARNLQAGRLTFTTDLAGAVSRAEVVFLAVGTPQAADGSADLTFLYQAVDQIGPHLSEDATLVTKSTVPVGTCTAIRKRLHESFGREADVASNPEFLREGSAVEDFKHPDRVVVGAVSERAAAKLTELYRPFVGDDRPLLVMSPESAELAKYVANAFLATKISFINEMANLCERLGGDVDNVRQGIGHDRRIGFEFLFPGIGYGGSCFPKDVKALSHIARQVGCESRMLNAVDDVNDAQKRTLFAKMEQTLGNLSGKRIAVWGLAFKPRTDDIREAPALVLIEELLRAGATVIAHDPEAMPNVRSCMGEATGFVDRPLDALIGADALAVCTEWDDYRSPDFAEMKRRMRSPVIFDGRNVYDPRTVAAAGFLYRSVGRPDVDGREEHSDPPVPTSVNAKAEI
ncbi:MAG TPA: UDP-glucose/GDP-mannose dehydrogenase family protein [Pirellulaceae bacterium]|nr:UDP-glucose/GDP-mannose dehydrogenase family protein [Pirellulaceae bacterium]